MKMKYNLTPFAASLIENDVFFSEKGSNIALKIASLTVVIIFQNDEEITTISTKHLMKIRCKIAPTGHGVVVKQEGSLWSIEYSNLRGKWKATFTKNVGRQRREGRHSSGLVKRSLDT
ncbi:hypothetical protein Adt_06415 [Abeliophyllum distichum]|uniref:Uncharacterized protein n=1 Tax=Abeliophyllum distichum TaxID=126358 RepID=A0ABD1V6V8_9LAMI